MRKGSAFLGISQTITVITPVFLFPCKKKEADDKKRKDCKKGDYL